MTDEMKPCPFCGGAPELDTQQHYCAMNGNLGKRCVIYCTNCSADMGMCYEDHRELSVDDMIFIINGAWNARAVLTDTAREGEYERGWKAAQEACAFVCVNERKASEEMYKATGSPSAKSRAHKASDIEHRIRALPTAPSNVGTGEAYPVSPTNGKEGKL